ncbi:MAG: nucleoside deaminase [Candidatus Omnitrophota bacterium]
MEKKSVNDLVFMEAAIARAREGIACGQTPFGACIVKKGKVISCEHNRVWKTTDITAHAEVTAIRAACRKLASIDLSGCSIYSTCEPCPMCFAACHWARIGRIVYGARIRDAKKYGFHELAVSNRTLTRMGRCGIDIRGGLLRGENIALFDEWARRKDKRSY